jgi:signal transducing adaptor molecule
MAHPPQHNYHQYAMRPAGQGYGAPGPAYGAQGGPPQDAQRYYTPGSQGDRPPFQTSSPPPNFPPPNQATPAPFYVAGAEVPSHAAPGQQPGGQQYPPHDNASRIPQGGNPPAPLNTSSPPAQNYAPYGQPPGQNPSSGYSQGPPGDQRPTSTYGAQELATSVYDSPIAPQGSNFGGPAYAPQDNNNNSSSNEPQNPSAPSAPYSQPPQYQSYVPPGHAAPPVPTGQPPQPPHDGMAPAPLSIGGPPSDSRHGLPSQGAAAGPPQYKAYVPPGEDDQNASAPNDYYRTGNY